SRAGDHVRAAGPFRPPRLGQRDCGRHRRTPRKGNHDHGLHRQERQDHRDRHPRRSRPASPARPLPQPWPVTIRPAARPCGPNPSPHPLRTAAPRSSAMSGDDRRTYETPVIAVEHDDSFLIALPYGKRTDGPKNVLHKGSATIVTHGHTYEVDSHGPTYFVGAKLGGRIPGIVATG